MKSSTAILILFLVALALAVWFVVLRQRTAPWEIVR